MPYNVKPFVVVFVLSLIYFWAARPLFSKFIDDNDFVRRRNSWLALTTAAFLLPSFWLYAALAVPWIAFAAARDKNPLAVYATLAFVIPPLAIPIPVVGINQLFDITQLRLLALVILLPAAVRLVNGDGVDKRTAFRSTDWALIAFGALQVALIVPYESPTNTIRRAFLFALDTFLIFYVFSRLSVNRRQAVDTLAQFSLICGLWALIAIFETLKGWLLYQGLNSGWGVPNVGAWLMRGESLRAQVSAGHSLNLGYLMTLGFAYWLYLQRSFASPKVRWGVAAWLLAGLIATYSRAPWLTAILCFLIFVAMQEKSAPLFLKAIGLFGIGAALLYVSPIGGAVIDLLPFIGTVDQQNVEYRQRLAETSWQLVQQHPFFGNPFVLLQMESLRQGQGIIDLVNAYATIALFYGLVTLFAFIAFCGILVWKGIVVVRRLHGVDSDLSVLGACLVAAMVSSLFFIGTALLETSTFVVAGLLGSFIRLGSNRLQSVPSTRVARNRVGFPAANPSH